MTASGWFSRMPDIGYNECTIPMGGIGLNYREILKENGYDGLPMLIRIGDEFVELSKEVVDEEMEYKVVSTDHPSGNRAYERSICFLMTRALNHLDPEARVIIEHSISRGLFCELSGIETSPQVLSAIKAEMTRLVEADLPIVPKVADRDEAIEIFRKSGRSEVVRLFESAEFEEIKLYELDGMTGFFYGPLAANTGDLKLFDLVPYKSGFVLMYPSQTIPDRVPDFYTQEKLYEIFRETGEWDSILGVSFLGELNQAIENNDGKRIVGVAEGLHEKKYAEIADEIRKRGDVRIVLIAGPSSSGKTTSSRRLAIQMMVNGMSPFPIEMDNYFVDRDKSPVLPDGTFDFESIHAIDLERFSEDIRRLMAGETVTPPIFDFKQGLSLPGHEELTIPRDGIMIIEGIHALNPELLSTIEDRFKFKIYVSALTQLNMDLHNRISTTDVRKIRRIIRDHRKRGWSSEETLELFTRVTRGEKKNIFPYQDQADEMFNTTLVYELAILKKHALPLLKSIGKGSPAYDEARRLTAMLNFVRDLPDEVVPANSILREFIGGSFFD